LCFQVEACEVAPRKFWECRGRDHGSVVGREGGIREVEIQVLRLSGALAETRIAGNATGDQGHAGTDVQCRGGGAAKQFFDDRMLKTRKKIKGWLRCGGQQFFERGFPKRTAPLDFRLDVVLLGPAQNGCLVATEAEVQIVAFHFGEGELYGMRITERSQFIDDRTAGISKAQEFRDFVVGFAGSVVARFAEEPVLANDANFEEMRVAAAYDQSDGGQRNRRMFEQNRVNVSFDMMDRDQGDLAGEAEGLGVCDTDKERTDKAGAGGDRDGRKTAKRNARLLQSLVNNRADSAQVFARGELGNDPAILCVNVELGSDDARANAATIFDNGGGGFVARTLDP
jgi:hypothetical protein